MGLGGKPMVFYSTSVSHPALYMLTLPPPGRTLIPLSVAVWPCDSVEDMGVDPGKIGANTGKQGRHTWRATCPDWSTKIGDSVNVSSVMSEKGSLGAQRRLFREHFGF